MASWKDDLLENINNAEEGIEIPDRLLEMVSGGNLGLGEKQYLEGAVIWYRDLLDYTCEQAMAYERDNRGRTEEELQVMRDIWDVVE